MMKMTVDLCIPKVTPEEMEYFAGDLKVPGDRREGQLLAVYDRVYIYLKSEMEKCVGLELPLLFRGNEVDRLALTYFNMDTEVNKLVGVLVGID